jgi:hypothetical protein
VEGIRLPRTVEDHPAAARLVSELSARALPLWAGGELAVPRVELAPALAAALESAFSAGRVVRGLEGAREALAAEDRGLRHVDRRTGVERGERVSRLLLLADDGAERFYRHVEGLVRQHRPRVLALRTEADERTLGALLFGPEQRARLVLLAHKETVSAVLVALAEHWANREPGADGEAGHGRYTRRP